jgi:hypothetical protein
MSMGRVPNSEDIEWAAQRVMDATEWLHTARHMIRYDQVATTEACLSLAVRAAGDALTILHLKPASGRDGK